MACSNIEGESCHDANIVAPVLSRLPKGTTFGAPMTSVLRESDVKCLDFLSTSLDSNS